jgi:predicted  nucleic acid-binding Zn-ribbon protein
MSEPYDPTAPQPVTPAAPSPATHAPAFIGGRIEAAQQVAAVSGWTLIVDEVEPVTPDQPDGMVLTQRPAPGVAMAPGSALSVDVIRRGASTPARSGGVGAAVVVIAAIVALGLGLLLGALLFGGGDGDEELVAERDAALAQVDVLTQQLADVTGVGGDLIEELNARIAELEQQLADASGADADVIGGLQGQIDTLTADLEAANARVTELTTANEELTDEVDVLSRQNEDLRTLNEELERQRAAAVAEADALRAEVTALQAQIATLEEQVATLNRQLGDIANAVQFMPAVVGEQLVGVEQFVTDNDLVLVVLRTADAGDTPVSPGTVITQSPAETTPLVAGSVVWVEVFDPDAS